MSKGRLFVVSGPSGVGKGTIVEKLLPLCPGLELSVSATTRQPRVGEKTAYITFSSLAKSSKR